MRGLGELVGLPLAEARRRLEGAGLAVQVTVTAAPDEPARRRARQVGPRDTLWRVVRAEWAGAATGDPDPRSPDPGDRASSARGDSEGARRIPAATGDGSPLAAPGDDGSGLKTAGGGDGAAAGVAAGDGVTAERAGDGGTANGSRTVRLVVAAFPLPPLPRADLQAALGEAARASWGPPTGGPERA